MRSCLPEGLTKVPETIDCRGVGEGFADMAIAYYPKDVGHAIVAA